MADPRLRKLAISTNVVKRIAKEKARYEEEVVQQTKLYDAKVTECADEYEIKMAKAILDESKMMLPDCQIRLDKALFALNELLQECAHDLDDTKEFLDAKTAYTDFSSSVK
ncbi:hypothetical protein CRM22_011150 [Opisthorchis felineus]|uniref:Tubulin-specific chaperone A n=1 Tax=Opisthorchis felineus TaxID=147828 RepID=A0A4S2KES8_OPIFE|nr:hypothetical protein CRM22_011150 [Opisthorchis felineus]